MFITLFILSNVILLLCLLDWKRQACNQARTIKIIQITSHTHPWPHSITGQWKYSKFVNRATVTRKGWGELIYMILRDPLLTRSVFSSNEMQIHLSGFGWQEKIQMNKTGRLLRSEAWRTKRWSYDPPWGWWVSFVLYANTLTLCC